MNKVIGLAETFKVGKLAVYSSQSLVIAVVAAAISIAASRQLKESIFLRLTKIASLVMIGWILIEMTMRYR
ncbi:MAG: hypothetical protein KKB51_09330 [Candidatus Riflebacteria bacterium]|nr:hypothetical protein [Candidatus Riflebacteria bacterium]